MRFRSLLLAVVLAASLTASAAQPGDAPSKELMQQLFDAWGTMNLDNAAPYYAKDAELLFFDIAPMKYSNWAEYRKGVEKLFADYQSFKLVIHDDLQIHVKGNSAWTACTWTADAVKKDGTKEKFDSRDTTVWEKRGGKWLIVHEHVSVPAP